MKFTIGSLIIAACLLLATSSHAQMAASTSVVPVQAGPPLIVKQAATTELPRDSNGQTPSSLDGLLMLALGASLVAIQLRRRQKTFRAPLLRT